MSGTNSNIVNVIRQTSSAKSLKLRGIKVEDIRVAEPGLGVVTMYVTISHIARRYEDNRAEYKVVIASDGSTYAYFERTFYEVA